MDDKLGVSGQFLKGKVLELVLKRLWLFVLFFCSLLEIFYVLKEINKGNG